MPLHPRLLAAVIPVLVAAQLALADAPAPVRLDREPFDGASLEQKIALVLSALDARDRELANFRYALRETCTNVNVRNRSRRFMQNAEYEMRRLDSTIWMHVVTHTLGEKDGGIDSERIVSWDGKVGTSLATPHVAHIVPKEDPDFLTRQFNALLGLRVHVDTTASLSRNSCAAP